MFTQFMIFNLKCASHLCNISSNENFKKHVRTKKGNDYKYGALTQKALSMKCMVYHSSQISWVGLEAY